MVELGFLMRGEIIWDKSASAGTSTAWGSWMSSSNPTLRDVHEYILVFSKGKYKRDKINKRNDTISRDDFLKSTKSVWTFSTESAKRIGHPAPFPVELPYRLIQLFSYSGEVILDPFIGSGQTAIAALKSQRLYVGYEIEPNYVKLANNRINEFRETMRKEKLDKFLPESSRQSD
jgi:site-specific DNA-methyltransferase (adenine-specific)